MIFTVSCGGTIAALAVGFATYMGSLSPHCTPTRCGPSAAFVDLTRGHLVALAAIAFQTLINIFGVRWGAVLQNIATWMKFAAIAAFS